MVNNDNLKKAFAMNESSADKLWDMWLVTLGSMSWTQEQIENMIRKYLDQRKTAREETTKLVEELMAQAKKNQQQMQKMMQEAITATMENVDIPSFKYFDDLNKKVDNLSEKVDKL